jgi:acetolactate synthase small subunit
METRKYTVTAVGKNGLDVMSRICSLYLQKQIIVESFSLEQKDENCAQYKICANTSENLIERIVKQIGNIIDIKSVDYTC